MKKRRMFNETFWAILEMSILAVGLGCAYLLGHYDSLRYQEMINEKLSNCYEVCQVIPIQNGCSQMQYTNFSILKNSTEKRDVYIK